MYLNPRSVEIINLVFHDFEELFTNSLLSIVEDLSSEELEKLLDDEKMNHLIEDFNNFIAEFVLDRHKFKLKDYINSIDEIRHSIIRQHEKQFEVYILLIEVCSNIYEKITEKVINNISLLTETVKIAVTLYGVILRKANQVLVLLASGQTDGAMVVWRSLYECTVIYFVLVIESDDQLTKKFVEHSGISDAKKAFSYQDNHKSLNFPPLSEDIISYYNKRKERLREKYDNNFMRSEYGWANDLFGSKANFRMLEDYIEFGSFRPYYIYCSQYIHSNYSSLLSSESNNKIDLSEFLVPRADRVSIVDPLQYTARLISEAADYMLWQFSVSTELHANRILITNIFNRLIISLGEEE